jgi:hypothetical protein
MNVRRYLVVAMLSTLIGAGSAAFGGALLEDFATMRPTGGVLVVRAETAEEARRIAAGDPSGLLEVEAIRPVLVSIGGKREEATND